MWEVQIISRYMGQGKHCYNKTILILNIYHLFIILGVIFRYQQNTTGMD